MRSILNILQIWFYEMKGIVKDKGILTFIVIVPLLYPLLYSFVYTNEVVRDVPVAVVDESNTALSRRLLRDIDATPDVELVARCDNMEEARRLIENHEAYGIVRIPGDFTKELSRGNQVPVGVYCDMSSMLYYKALLLAVTNVSLEINKDIKVSGYLPGTTDRQDEISRMPIEYDYVSLYNPQSGFAAFLIPPVLMLIIQQTLLLGIGMSAGNSRELYMGSLVPFHPWYKNAVHIVVGKALPYFMLYMLFAVYMFTAVTRMFTLPQLGDYGTLIAFVTPYILACIFIAMVLSSFIYRREDCILLIVFLSVPMLFLSGLSWPGASMPLFWKYVSWLFPSTFGMNGYVRIMSMNASLDDVRVEYMALWIQAGVYFILACILYRRQITRLIHRHGTHRDVKPSLINIKHNGVDYHIAESYRDMTQRIIELPGHDYKPLHTYCNNRNEVERIELDGRSFVIKKYKRPTLANCVIYTWFRKNKARRSFENALRLKTLGIGTATPVAYFSRRRYGFFHTGWFLCEYLPYDTLASVYEPGYDILRREVITRAFVKFTARLHDMGIRHKDYNPGNILFHKEADGYEFALVDINRMTFGRRPGIYRSVSSFMQCDLGLKDIFPIVDYYAGCRNFPVMLCHYFCHRYRVVLQARYLVKWPLKRCVSVVKSAF